MARQRRTSEAVAHFQAAAQSADPTLRDAAKTRLAPCVRSRLPSSDDEIPVDNLR